MKRNSQEFAINGGLLTSWLLLLVTSLVTGFTPLTFTSLVVRNACWLLAAALSFIMTRMLAQHVHNQVSRLFIKRLLATVVAGFVVVVCFNLPWSLPELANGVLGHWETVQITHRSCDTPATHIALQMLDVGARGYRKRTVLVQPITPLFYWLSEAPTALDAKQWRAVQEDFNPFDWKGA